MKYFKLLWNFFISFKGYLLILFISFSIKIILETPTISSAINLFVIGLVYSFICWLNLHKKSKEEINKREDVVKELEDLRSKLIRLNLEFQNSKRK